MVLFERLCTTSPLSSLDAATASSRDSDESSSRLLELEEEEEEEAADDITQTITPENTNNANHLILIININALVKYR